MPNQLTQTIVTENNIKLVRNLLPENFYAQDQWTRNRLTVQGGVRFDYLKSTYPDSRVGGPGYPYAPQEIFYPARSTPGYGWKDVTPRLGAAYDLFGDGKTAFKFNLGKYMEAITATNNDLDMNPLIRTTIQTTRGWTDTNRTTCRTAISATPRRTANARPWTIRPSARGCSTGSSTLATSPAGERAPYNWGLGLSVQQELMPRVSVNVGYLPQLVGQLVRGRQPGDQLRGLHAVQHHGAGGSAAAGRRRPGRQRPVQPRA